MTKAYVVPSAGAKLELADIELPALGDNDVKIKVAFCGICHSDLSMIDNEWGMSDYPLVAGHEVVGEVVDMGPKVENVKKGDIVGLGWHSDYCHKCTSCYSGDQNLCASAQGTIVGRHGGFAEYVVANEMSVVSLPEGVDMKVAGPLFCGGITVFNPLVQFDIKPTDKVAVIGIGGLGHIALQFLNAWGCEVTAFTSSESKANEAKQMGAHHVVNSRDKKEIASVAGAFDLIISTVNVRLDWNLYLSCLKAKGRLHFVGATLEPLDIGAFSLIGGQKSVSGSPVGSPGTIASMLDFAAQHGIKPVIEMYDMSQVNSAISHLKAGDARYRIVLQADF